MQKKFFTLVLAMFMMLTMTTPVIASFSAQQEYVRLQDLQSEDFDFVPVLEGAYVGIAEDGSRGFINVVIRIIRRF